MANLTITDRNRGAQLFSHVTHAASHKPEHPPLKGGSCDAALCGGEGGQLADDGKRRRRWLERPDANAPGRSEIGVWHQEPRDD